MGMKDMTPEADKYLGDHTPEVATVEDLIQDRSQIESEEFVLSSGKVVRFRPLTRAQALGVRQRKMRPDVFEQTIISLALVDPEISPAQVKAWQAVDRADGNLHKLCARITEVSGLVKKVEGTDKDGNKSKDES
jgi:hypothetical protein